MANRAMGKQERLGKSVKRPLYRGRNWGLIPEVTEVTQETSYVGGQVQKKQKLFAGCWGRFKEEGTRNVGYSEGGVQGRKTSLRSEKKANPHREEKKTARMTPSAVS